MIPGADLNLSSGAQESLLAEVDSLLEDALGAHEDVVSELNDWDNLYIAKPKHAKKDFPWKGAANVVIPLIGTVTDSIVARTVNTIHSVKPLWTINPLVPQTQDMAKAAEDFLEWSQNAELRAYRSIKRFVLDVTQNGWGWLKPRWDNTTRRIYNSALGKWEDVAISAPVLDHVPVRDVILQKGVEDPNQAEIIVHRLRYTKTEMWDRYFAEPRRFGKGLSQTEFAELLENNPREDRSEELGGSEDDPRLTIYEIWGRLSIPGQADRRPVAFTLWYHRASKKALRLIHNPTIDQRPSLLIKGNFIERNNSLKGVGIAPMLRDLQHELTTVHRQQLDNSTLANTRFFIGRRGIGLHSNTKIWPGRFLLVPNPKEDIRTEQLGDIYNSLHNLEVSILAFAERRSGISDPQLGRESSVLGSRATATGTMAIIQEGNRRFDLNTRDMRDVLGEVGQVMLQLNHQFRKPGFEFFVQGKRGQLTGDVLNMPAEIARARVAVELTASTATINKQVEQQGLLALNQVLINHMQLGQQTAMLLSHPQVPENVKAYVANFMSMLDDHTRRIARTFDVRDFDSIPSVLGQEIANGATGPLAIPGPQGAPGPASGAQNLSPMEALP